MKSVAFAFLVLLLLPECGHARLSLGQRVGAIAPTANPHSWCFAEAAAAIAVDSDLLRGIAKTESSMRVAAINDTHFAATGTRDIGVMQINSGHLLALQSIGITEARLLSEPCTNIRVASALLSELIERHGSTWNAVGAFNAACVKLKGDACTKARSLYVSKVHRAFSAHKRIAAPTVLPAAMLVPMGTSPSAGASLRLVSAAGSTFPRSATRVATGPSLRVTGSTEPPTTESP